MTNLRSDDDDYFKSIKFLYYHHQHLMQINHIKLSEMIYDGDDEMEEERRVMPTQMPHGD